jgi:hypothetical protein
MLAQEIYRDKNLFSNESLTNIDVNSIINAILEGLNKMTLKKTIFCITNPRSHSSSILQNMLAREDGREIVQ